jgi:hypothetical protein
VARGGGTTLGSRGAWEVSPKTVHNHASNIITKLHVSDRSGAIHPGTTLGRRRVGLTYPRQLGVKKLECHHR